MNWDLLDFVVFATMVIVVAVIMILAWRRARTGTYRFTAAVAALGAFFLVWINGAVGIIGNEDNEANLLFFGVLGVAAIGSVIARFRANGMANALYATAAAQVLLGAFAFATRLGATGPIWPRDILMMTAFFSAFWLISGMLFSKAARTERRLFLD